MPTIPTDIQIKRSTFKAIRVLIVLLAFAVIGAVFLVNPHLATLPLGLDDSPWIVQAMSIASILFFGGGFVLVMSLLLKTNPVNLSIDEQGITDNTSLSSLGFINWKDVKAVEKVKLSGAQTAIIIKVANPEAYLSQAKGGWARYIQNRNMKAYGTPVVIQAAFLKISSSQLYSLLKAELNKHRHFIIE